MASNLVLITSVIDTPNKPLSYSKIRSVFTKDERFQQTKQTIESIKKYIPGSKLMIVECSNFTEEEEAYLKSACDIVLNLWENKIIHNKIFGISKLVGEGTLMIEGFNYIKKNNINFTSLIKISGRYFLNNDFILDNYISNESFVCKKINNDINNISATIYKFAYKYFDIFHNFLIAKISFDIKYGYENLIGIFIKILINNSKKNVIFLDNLGIEGYVTVCGTHYIS